MARRSANWKEVEKEFLKDLIQILDVEFKVESDMEEAVIAFYRGKFQAKLQNYENPNTAE